MDSQAKMLSVKEAATYLGVCDATVRRMLRDGQLSAYRVRRVWRIPLVELHKKLGRMSV